MRHVSTTIIKYPESREAYRRARGKARPRISQENLALAVGITRRHMIRIENGEHRPLPELRNRIADVLGADPSTLPAAEVMFPFEEEEI